MGNIRTAYPEAARGKQNERGVTLCAFVDDTPNGGKAKTFKKEKR